MQKSIAAVLGMLLLVTMVGLPGGVLAQVPPQAPGASNPANPAGAGARGGERHPEMQIAIRHLERVKSLLEHKAAHDFGGHKKAAIGHIDQAIEELRAGLQSDKQ
jgi:hypothetical protein